MLSKVIGIARQIRRSVGFRTAVSIPKRIAVATRQRTNNGVFSVEIEGDCGFFAIMQMILFILVHCEKNDLYPDISAKGGMYGEKNATVDWFKQLFASIYIPKPTIAQRLIKRTDIRTSKIKGIADLGFRARYEMDLTLEESSKLFENIIGRRQTSSPKLTVFAMTPAFLRIPLECTIAARIKYTNR